MRQSSRAEIMKQIEIAANTVIVVVSDSEDNPINGSIMQCVLQRRALARYILVNKFETKDGYEFDLFDKYNNELKKLIGL